MADFKPAESKKAVWLTLISKTALFLIMQIAGNRFVTVWQ